MGTFGNEFRNVLEVGPPAPAHTDARDTRPELQAIIDQADGRAPGLAGANPGGIVYLPPGTYVIRAVARPAGSTLQDAINEADLWIKTNVLLWFAPGAILRLSPNVVVLIQGTIRAEQKQIFEIIAPGPDQRRARVVFGTAKVPELYPEWWGAKSRFENTTPSSPDDNILPLEDCFRAAHSDRRWRGAQLPVIPVVLRGEYAIGRELEIAPLLVNRTATGAIDTSDPRLRERTGVENRDGIILRGVRGTGSSGVIPPSLYAIGTGFGAFGERAARGRALLRINELHGSLIEGVGFDGNGIASACMQITGNNARSSVFRDCAFTKALHVLAQVGDYVIEDATRSNTTQRNSSGAALPLLDPSVNGGWDLSGLTFENCVFDSGISVDDVLTRSDTVTQAQVDEREQRRIVQMARAYRLSGIMFHAGNTLPMILDHCFFSGPMLACVEAYSGALVVRGGGAQCQLYGEDTPGTPPQRTPSRRERPRGGTDIFIADPVLPTISAAAYPTGVTVVQFESQSMQFLDTFRHVSASSGRVPFLPTVLQAVTARNTLPFDLTPSILFWSGPGITPGGRMGDAIAPAAGSGAPLTLVGCVFRGQRPFDSASVATGGEPPGAVVVDKESFLVSDVGTSLSPQSGGSDRSGFWQFDRMAMRSSPARFRSIQGGNIAELFPFYRRL